MARDARVESLEPRLLLATYDGLYPNVGMDLRTLHEEYLQHVAAGGAAGAFDTSSSASAKNLWVQGDAVYSTVRVAGDFGSVLDLLQGAGFAVAASNSEGGVIEGYLPLGALGAIATATGVASVMPVTFLDPTDGQGSAANEAEWVLLADYTKGLFDVDGTGVTVGVISDSVSRVAGGLADSVASGDLPAGIPVYLEGPVDGLDEGRAMLELIHDIAPGADLAFASGAGGDAAMAAAIATLVANGADIIVDDLNGLSTEPFFQDGLAAQAVQAAVAAGVTYFSSAGDWGRSGYEAATNLKAYSDPFPDLVEIGAGVYHDWNGADDVTQTITLAPGVTDIVFQWDDPFGAVTSDMDVWLVNADGTAVLDAGLEFSIANGEPREFLHYNNLSGAPITAQLVIQRFSGTDAARFKWIGFNAPTVVEHLDVAGAFNNPHNPGHNGTEQAISVAATSWQTPTTPASYTAQGPVTRTRDAAGNPIGLQLIEKPDLTAVDQVTTSVPGFAPLVGTSASAPNAAAVAALLLQYQTTLTPAEIRTTLVDSATDIGEAGFDYVTGHGLIQSLDAMLALTNRVLPLVGDRDFADQDDTFVLTLYTGADTDHPLLESPLLEVTLNGVLLGRVELAALDLVTIDARGGSDILIVDQSNGLVTVPIQYEGGTGASDRLIHTGDPGVEMHGHYTTAPSTATGHAGLLSYNDGAVQIAFTGLEPVEDLVPAATLAIDDTIDANVINVVDGALSTVPDPVTLARETTYEVNFGGLAESIQFRNKVEVTVNALGGDDLITVNIAPLSTDDALDALIVHGDAGADTFHIQADQLVPDARHVFRGDAGVDLFNVSLAAGATVVGSSVQIDGGADDNNTSSRDTVSVRDGGGARTMAWTYQSASSGDLVLDIDGGAPLQITTTEQVLWTGDAAHDDVVTLFGTAGDDDLTVAPLSASAVLAFLNGNPWGGPADADAFTAAYPGLAGGGAGPDILIEGLAQTGLTVDGNGAVNGDQLYVYAPSELDLVDPATTVAPFGLLGAGVIVPGWGTGNAYDGIIVTDALVAIQNAVAGPLVAVNINTASFRQVADSLTPGLIVNTGSEALPSSSGVADDITALQSYDIAIRINGGDPDPAFAPQGDRLSLTTAGEINVYSDKAVPPAVTITTSDPASGLLSKALTWSSIEDVVLTPGLTSQTVNLIGDNNDPEVDQNDHFVVVGADVDSTLPALGALAGNPAFNPTGAVADPRFEIDTDGANEFFLMINGSAPIGFRNVVFLNVFGDDRNPAPGTPSVGPDDIDTLELTPYADNTPAGWGIDVRFDEGNPVQDDGAAADLLIYHTAQHVGVSEDIVVRPSGAERGEVRVTNGAFGTPIVAISYSTNLDLIVLDDDGDLSDTDTLRLQGTNADNPGTSGDDRVIADFSAAGDVAHPMVVVSDANPVNPLEPILYRVRDFQGFDTVTLDTLGGADTISVIGRADNSLLVNVLSGGGSDTILVAPAQAAGAGLFVNVDGGAPYTGDALVIADLDAAGNPVQLGADDFVVVGRGRVPDAGTVQTYRSGVRTPGIAYENVEIVAPHVAGGDNLLILGPDRYESNEFRQTATYLGSGAALNVRDLSIFPHGNEHLGVPADQDYYRVVAAETGILDVLVHFHIYDAGLFPAGGDLNVEVVDGNGNVIGGAGTFGNADATPDARVRIPAVAGQSYYVRVFGATADVINGYDMTILHTALPVPYGIELVDLPVDPGYDTTQDPPASNSDTGRSHLDDVTADNSPAIIVRLDDGILRHDLPGNGTDGSPPDEVIAIPFNPSLDPASTAAGFRVAIYVEGDPQQPGVSPQTVIGYALPGAVEGVYVFDFDDAVVPDAVDLVDGSHFISARVEIIDPATPTQRGYGARSAALEIVIDTEIPLISSLDLVDDGLCPYAPDHVTNNTSPSFHGYAEANSIVRFYLDLNANGTLELDVDRLLGETVAVPYDGNNQFPNGYYTFTTPVDLNDPALGLPYDGLRTIFGTAEDLAGNVTPESEAFVARFFLDTQGPQITSVIVTSDPTYDLFDPKPSTSGPTPLVDSLTINVRDLSNRESPDLLHPALVAAIATHPGYFQVVGDANGIIPIESVAFVTAPVVGGAPATGSIVITFVDPLPDDRYTLIVADELMDPACNRLDGESNADEPHETVLFPTGDRVPGGDFVARFTIDSRPEIGVWAAGNVWVDTNGNMTFDPTNADYTNRDIIYQLGYTSDDVFAGNFSALPGDVADGFDKLAVYGKVGKVWRWLVDTDNNGVADIEQIDPLNINGLPVAGEFDGNVANGDEVALFTGTTWYFDRNHDYRVDADTALVTAMRGYPIVGDFDGDGFDDLATLTDDRFQVDLANGVLRGWDGVADHTFTYGYIGVRARPVAADMDQDGFDDFGVWDPDRSGTLPREAGEWNFLVSNGASVLDRIEVDPITGGHRVTFTPVPFGPDMYAKFGDDYALPVVGNFDPPVTGGGSISKPGGNLHTNLHLPLDVNDDGFVTPLDALLVINRLNQDGGGRLSGLATSQPYLDVNMDGFLSPIDPLIVINYLNRNSGGGEAEGELQGAAAYNSAAVALDNVLDDTMPWAGESALANVVVLGDAIRGAGITVVQTAVANPQAAVVGYTASVGYLPFAAQELWLESVGDEALREYLEAAQEPGLLDTLSLDDLLSQAAVDVRDAARSAVDEVFQRWNQA